MAPRLDSHQNDWVEAKVKEVFEPSKAVNSVLLGKSGVPALPQEEQVLRLAQAALTREQVDFMMGAEQGERPVFTYQTKLVSPSSRTDLVKALLDGQPKTMSTKVQDQQPLWMWEPAEKHLAGRPSRVVAPSWYWELGQGDQIIKTPQQGDDSSLALTDRDREFLRSLPAGMRGTDRYTWATRMAAGMRDGKPLDVRFKGNATNTTEAEQWNFTVLDEEREFTEGGNRCLVYGDFNPVLRRASVNSCSAGTRDVNARFRASVDGSTKA